MSSQILNFKKSAVAIDANGGRYITQAFRFPDRSQGIAIIMKVTDQDWEPEVKDIIINYRDKNDAED